MQVYLDSLEAQKEIYLEYTIGYESKAQKLLKKIDTIIISKQQVDNILTYYKYDRYKFEEYPYPLLLWSKKISEQIGYKEGIVQSIITMGDTKRLAITHPKEYFEHYNHALKIYEASDNQKGVADMFSRIGLSYMSLRKYDASLKELFKALDIYKSLNNDKKIANTYHNIGDVYRHLKDTENAIKFIKKSIQFNKKSPQSDLKVMNTGFLGELYIKQNKLQIAKGLLLLSNKTIDSTKDCPYMYVYNYKNLGVIEEKRVNLYKAFYYYKKALSGVYIVKKEIHQKILFSTRMADILLQQQKVTEAIELLEHIEQKKIKKENIKSQGLYEQGRVGFYQILAKAHEFNKNFVKANYYNKQSIKSINKFNSLEQLKNSSELEKKYQSKIDAQEILLLKNKNQLKQRDYYISLFSILVISLLLIGVYIYFSQQSKTLIQKAELSKLALHTEQLKTEKVKNDNYIVQLELELKQRQLTSNSITLLQKNKQLEDITNTLKEIKPLVGDIGVLKILNSSISKYKALKTSYNWSEFKLTFEGVHPKFYKNIIKKHPTLSNNEKKLCAFLKLRLNTKEISAITQQSSRTIIISRSRLRKKLDLEKKDNLTTYIAKF